MTRKTPPPHGTEEGTDLWRILLAPAIWVAHFLALYIAVAIYCEKAGRAALLQPLWPAVLGLTLAALGAILLVARAVWAVHARSRTEGDCDFEQDSPEERHRFLSHMALMLAALSAGAVCFTAWPVLTMELCR